MYVMSSPRSMQVSRHHLASHVLPDLCCAEVMASSRSGGVVSSVSSHQPVRRSVARPRNIASSENGQLRFRRVSSGSTWPNSTRTTSDGSFTPHWRTGSAHEGPSGSSMCRWLRTPVMTASMDRADARPSYNAWENSAAAGESMSACMATTAEEPRSRQVSIRSANSAAGACAWRQALRTTSRGVQEP